MALEGLGDRFPAIAIGSTMNGILTANFPFCWVLDGVAELFGEALDGTFVDPARFGCGYIFVDIDAVGEDGGNACGEGFGGGDAKVFVVGGEDEEVTEGEEGAFAIAPNKASLGDVVFEVGVIDLVVDTLFVGGVLGVAACKDKVEFEAFVDELLEGREEEVEAFFGCNAGEEEEEGAICG